jgi:hypothetical protein
MYDIGCANSLCFAMEFRAPDSKLDSSGVETSHASSLARNNDNKTTMPIRGVLSTESMICYGFSKFEAGGDASP